MVFGIAAHVFYHHRYLDKILNLTDLLCGHVRGFESVGHWQQIMCVAAVNTAPTKMIGEPRRSRTADEVLQPLQMFATQPLSGAEVHRNSMLHDSILFQNLVEDSKR